MNKQELIRKIEQLTEASMFVRVNRNTSIVVKKQDVLQLVNQLDEPNKPTVPQVAIEYYEKYKNDKFTFTEWYSDFYDEQCQKEFPKWKKLVDWLYSYDNKTTKQREFALATLITYGVEAVEVEKEMLYKVDLGRLGRLVKRGDTMEFRAIHEPYRYEDALLTKEEIESVHPILMQIAKEV